MENLIPSTGANESQHDERTVIHLGDLASPLPVEYKINYSGYAHKNQMKVGICTAATVSMLAERYFGDGVKLSMEWLYKMGKVLIDGNTTEGSSIFTMLKVAQKYGIPNENDYPSNCNRSYDDFMADTTITDKMLTNANLHKIPGYASVRIDPDSLKEALVASKCGLATRMALGNTFWVSENGEVTWDKNKLELIRPPKEITSGHAIIFAGYNGEIFMDRNSWSEAWCDNGDCHYDFNVMKPFITEAFAIVDKILFIKDLSIGMVDDSVVRLQKFLNNHNFLVSTTGAGSPGGETNYFGLKTFEALKKWQSKNGIPSTGYFGALSRAKANS